MKLVQFGAGNIGRSFIGQVFSASGWDVVFIDVDEKLISLLNERKYYTVVIKREGKADEARKIGPVRAINGRDPAAIGELMDTDIVSTSVGKNALPGILPLIAGGLVERRAKYGDRPLDIILAENAREAPALFRTVLARELGPSYPLEKLVGIVETSIGKMVPIMRAGDLASDPLLLFAEEYETLIVDKRGFRGKIPAVSNLFPVEPIEAYVDRKLFIHNLGHAAAAYLGYQALTASGDAVRLETATLPQALALPGVAAKVRQAMHESAAALLQEYPRVFTATDLESHIADLLARFANTALGDTVHRVGRDLRRKLGREDRLTGTMLLCAKRGLPFTAIAEVYHAALAFTCPAEDGTLFPPDAAFRKAYSLDSPADTGQALSRIMEEVSGLRRNETPDSIVAKTLWIGS